jgi:hypothetical protein
VGFELTAPVCERARTLHAPDPIDAVIGCSRRSLLMVEAVCIVCVYNLEHPAQPVCVQDI